jgi:hypothetical protein
MYDDSLHYPFWDFLRAVFQWIFEDFPDETESNIYEYELQPIRHTIISPSPLLQPLVPAQLGSPSSSPCPSSPPFHLSESIPIETIPLESITRYRKTTIDTENDNTVCDFEIIEIHDVNDSEKMD